MRKESGKVLMRPGRGGKRQGAGRKPLPEEQRLVPLRLSVSAKDFALYQKLREVEQVKIEGLRFVDWWLVSAIRDAAKDYGL